MTPGSDGYDYDGLDSRAFVGFNNTRYQSLGFHISDAAGNSAIGSGIAAVQRQTYLLVLKAEFLSGNDRLTLYVDPPLTGEPAISTVDTGLDVLQPTVIQFKISGAQSFDELRIGTTYADVTAVPEPATLSVLGLFIVVEWSNRRQKR